MSGIWQQIGLDIDGEAIEDWSGISVSLSSDGKIVAIGAPYNNGNGTDSGHVRVYAWNGTSWQQRGSDINGEASNNFSGASVSLSSDGNILAIGAPFNNNGIGHVRIYAWNGTSWQQRGSDIDGEAINDYSGNSVSLSSDGNIVAIGAPYNNNSNGVDSGHVRIYAWNGTSWQQRGSDIDGEASTDYSGTLVSLSSDGNIVAIGATYNNNSNGADSGHVRVYAWNGTSWQQRGSDIDGEAANDQSSISISLNSNGNILAIGAYFNDANGTNSGHVRVYAWNGTSWQQRGSDIDGEDTLDNSGISVSLSSDGNIIAIGAPNNTNSRGHVRVYAWNGISWQQRSSDIKGENVGDLSGRSVSLNSSGTILAIGAYLNDGNSTNSGHVRIYEYIISPVSQPIDIDLDITLDASSNIILFQGITSDLSANEIILATYQVPVRTIYDLSGNKGLIEFWEPSSELDNIYVRLADGSGTDASDSYNFTGAYQTAAKRLVKQMEKVLVNQFDCSSAVPFETYTDERYYKQRDFARVALGQMAHDIFGHVDATAAISNDVAYTRAMLSLTNDASGNAAAQLGDSSGGYIERYNAWSKKTDVSGNVQTWNNTFSATDANLAQRMVRALIYKGLNNVDGQDVVYISDVKAAEGNSNLKTLARIVGHIINKDVSRLFGADNSERTKDKHHLLKFIPGDKLYFNIRLAKPNITVGNNAPTGVLATSINEKSQERTYTIKVVLYDDSAAPQQIDNINIYN